MNETLRLYPSVPLNGKVALNDDTLPDGTFIPKATSVAFDIFSMGRDCSLWGDDAETFRPERWLEMSKAPGPFEHMVFNAGPRECLGKRLAMVEMKTCLAMLLPHVSFRLAVPSSEITPDQQLTIGMGRGLPCFVDRAVMPCSRKNSSTTAAALSECDSISSAVTGEAVDASVDA